MNFKNMVLMKIVTRGGEGFCRLVRNSKLNTALFIFEKS